MTGKNANQPQGDDPKPVHPEPPSGSAALETLLDSLYGLHPKLIDLSLTRIERFLKDLGNPHLHLPPVIHVAGTNGKGSTIATLRAILEEHGYSCHVAISPHLVRINERIVLAGKEIDDETLKALLIECMAKTKNQDLTFFEMIIAVTFLAFSRTPADICLLETGLGGRLDATNVVPAPAVTVITDISADHQDFLGQTLPEIAAEKAGIIKPGVPCVIGKQNAAAARADVLCTIQSIASSTGAPTHAFGADWSIEPHKDQMRFTDGHGELLLQKPSLCGTHQIFNAGAAIAALRIIPEINLDAKKISTGLGKIHWPARLQRIEKGPFSRVLPPAWSLWLDGGHNDSAGEILADQIRAWKNESAEPVHLILGMLSRKNPVSFAGPLIPLAASITTVPVPEEESALSPEDLKDCLTPLQPAQINCAESVNEALHTIVQNSSEPGKILITGSLYLAGHVLSAPGKP